MARVQLGDLDVATQIVTLSDTAALRIDFVRGHPSATLYVGKEALEAKCKPPVAIEGFVCLPFSAVYPPPLGVAPAGLPAFANHPEVILQLSADEEFGTTTFEYNALYYSEDHVPAGTEGGLWAEVTSPCPDYPDILYNTMIAGNMDWQGTEENRLSCSWFGTRCRYFEGSEGRSFATIDGLTYNAVSRFTGPYIFFRGVVIVLDGTLVASLPTGPAIDDFRHSVAGCGMRFVTGDPSVDDGLYLFAVIHDFVSSDYYMIRWKVVDDPTYKYVVEGGLVMDAHEVFNIDSFVTLAAFNSSCTMMHMVVQNGETNQGDPGMHFGLKVDLSNPGAMFFDRTFEDYDRYDFDYSLNLNSIVRPTSGSNYVGANTSCAPACCNNPVCSQNQLKRDPICVANFGSGLDATQEYDEETKFLLAYDYRGEELVRVFSTTRYMRERTWEADGTSQVSQPSETICEDAQDCEDEPLPSCSDYDAEASYMSTFSGEAEQTRSWYDLRTETLSVEYSNTPADNMTFEFYREETTWEYSSSGTNSGSSTLSYALERPPFTPPACPSCTFANTGFVLNNIAGFVEYEDIYETRNTTLFYQLDARVRSAVYIREEVASYEGYTLIRNAQFTEASESFSNTYTDESSETVHQEWGMQLFGGPEVIFREFDCPGFSTSSSASNSIDWDLGCGDYCSYSAGCALTGITHSLTGLEVFGVFITEGCGFWSSSPGVDVDSFSIYPKDYLIRYATVEDIVYSGSYGGSSGACIAPNSEWYYRLHPDINIAYPYGVAFEAFTEAAFISIPVTSNGTIMFYTYLSDGESATAETQVGGSDTTNTFYPIHYHYDKFLPDGV